MVGTDKGGSTGNGSLEARVKDRMMLAIRVESGRKGEGRTHVSEVRSVTLTSGLSGGNLGGTTGTS